MNGASQVRRISHQLNNRDMPLTVESMGASTVRSYISFRVADCMPPVLKFQLLRVLDMEHGFSMDPVCLDLSFINHLFLLKYVRVWGFRPELPKKFGKLNHLMTLDIYGRYCREQLSDFSSLSSLRHLSLPGPVVFKNGLSKLCNLRDLSPFNIATNSIECIRDLGELINLRHLCVINLGTDGAENNHKTAVLAASLDKLGKNNLRHLYFEAGSSESAPSAEFWSNCLTRPWHLQRLYLLHVLMPKLPNWIAHADRLVHAVLKVQELRSDDVQLLAHLQCLVYLYLKAKTVPENNIIIHPNTFNSLKNFRFFFRGERPRLTFEADAMPRLQGLYVGLDARRQGAMQLQEGSSPVGVGGIEHLASLEEISLFIRAKCGQGSKIESACRDTISRHPKSQAMKIDVSNYEYDENGRRITNTVAGTSGED